jgi:hypothetical protein
MREPQMQMVLIGLEILRRAGRKLGPYLLLEILMPGGTLLALLLFLYRRGKLHAGTNTPRTALTLSRVLGRIAEAAKVRGLYC